jgi:hypothetical protein
LLRPNRKQLVSQFSPDKNGVTVVLLAALFIAGLMIALHHTFFGIAAYLGLWALSYVIIYAGTCRYCTYYGKKCPVPLEGSCVHHLFEKKESGFGWMQLVWATVVYILRILIPAIIMINEKLYTWGVVYLIIFLCFWIVHLRIAGCPNCMNAECPLNPDYMSTN